MTFVKLARTLSDIIAVILESKRLGAIVTTLIPYRARSRVIGKVREAMAPFDALYATSRMSATEIRGFKRTDPGPVDRQTQRKMLP